MSLRLIKCNFTRTCQTWCLSQNSQHSMLKKYNHINSDITANADDRRTRNLYEKLARVNLREKLVHVSYRIAARFFSCEFLASNRTSSIWCEKLAITWLNLRTLIGYPGWAQATSISRCKFLVRETCIKKFDASFSCEFLVRVSRTSFLYVCLGHYILSLCDTNHEVMAVNKAAGNTESSYHFDMSLCSSSV